MRTWVGCVLSLLRAWSAYGSWPYWERVPLGEVPENALSDSPSPEWWNAVSPDKYMNHNIMRETTLYDHEFRRSEVINSEMAAVAHKLTNGQRRKAILQCVVALNDFMKHFNATYKDAYWWPEGGSLIGTQRGKKFIPWDDDADMTMTKHTWDAVVKHLASQNHSKAGDTIPKPKGTKCGCLIIDTGSFGSERPSSGYGYNGIPGRAINECTGNYVDIFIAVAEMYGTPQARYKLSQPQPARWAESEWSWREGDIFPLVSCSLSHIPLQCPREAHKYLLEYYSHPRFADHVWNATAKEFVYQAWHAAPTTAPSAAAKPQIGKPSATSESEKAIQNKLNAMTTAPGVAPSATPASAPSSRAPTTRHAASQLWGHCECSGCHGGSEKRLAHSASACFEACDADDACLGAMFTEHMAHCYLYPSRIKLLRGMNAGYSCMVKSHATRPPTPAPLTAAPKTVSFNFKALSKAVASAKGLRGSADTRLKWLWRRVISICAHDPAACKRQMRIFRRQRTLK